MPRQLALTDWFSREARVTPGSAQPPCGILPLDFSDWRSPCCAIGGQWASLSYSVRSSRLAMESWCYETMRRLGAFFLYTGVGQLYVCCLLLCCSALQNGVPAKNREIVCIVVYIQNISSWRRGPTHLKCRRPGRFSITAARIFRRTLLDSPVTARRTQAIVHQFRTVLETHFLQVRSVAAYARMLKITSGHLSDSVLHRSGRGGGLIRDSLVLEAQRLLVHSSPNVAEIAIALQIEDPSYFSRFFRRSAGISPGEFRDQVVHSAGIAVANGQSRRPRWLWINERHRTSGAHDEP